MARQGDKAHQGANIVVRERMKSLRHIMRLPNSEFALLVGLIGARLGNRERGVSPWRTGEVSQVKRKISEHLKTVEKALAALDA